MIARDQGPKKKNPVDMRNKFLSCTKKEKQLIKKLQYFSKNQQSYREIILTLKALAFSIAKYLMTAISISNNPSSQIMRQIKKYNVNSMEFPKSQTNLGEEKAEPVLFSLYNHIQVTYSYILAPIQ